MEFCIRWIGLAIAVAVLSGCSSLDRFSGALLVQESAINKENLLRDAQFNPAKEEYLKASNELSRRDIRDSYVISKFALIDIRFAEYARSIATDRKTIDTAVDASQMTLGVAATLAGSVQAKGNLAALLTLVTGVKASVDNHCFFQQSLDIFLQSMVASRKQASVPILSGLGQTTVQYSLMMAERDLLAYENAGSPKGAFQALSNDATKRGEAAEQQIRFIQLIQDGTVLKDVPNLPKSAVELKSKLSMAIDPKTLSTATMTNALKALGANPGNLPNDNDKLAEALANYVRSAQTKDQIAFVAEKFKQSGIPLN